MPRPASTGRRRLRATVTMLVGVGAVLTGAGPAAAHHRDTSGLYADDDGSVHERTIEALAYAELTSGCGIGRFCADAPVTRGQLAAFIVRSLPTPTTRVDHFVDDDDSMFESALDRLAAGGHIHGCDPPADTRVCPDAAVTRGQLASVLGSALELEPDGTDRFVDDDRSVHEAAINAFAAAGITRGCNPPTNDRFCPDEAVTRAQLASFLARTLSLPPRPVGTAVDAFHPLALSSAGIELRLPSSAVELIGLHQSSHEGAQPIEVIDDATPAVTMSSRGRGTTLTGAADIVVHPDVEVRAPVTGTVKRASTYTLYCRYTDAYVVIEPDGHRGMEVKLLHVTGLHVAPGSRVVAGVTVVADHATQLPFASQVDDHSRSTDWPHVHLEVVDTAIPNTGGGSC